MDRSRVVTIGARGGAGLDMRDNPRCIGLTGFGQMNSLADPLSCTLLAEARVRIKRRANGPQKAGGNSPAQRQRNTSFSRQV